jgi:hypothetical protein
MFGDTAIGCDADLPAEVERAAGKVTSTAWGAAPTSVRIFRTAAMPTIAGQHDRPRAIGDISSRQLIRRKAQAGLPPNRSEDRDILLLDVSGGDDFNGKLSAILYNSR